MSHAGGRGAVATVTALVAATALLAGCASLPADAAWVAPAWPPNASFAAVVDGPEAGSGSPAEQLTADTAGLVDGRIRNDRAGLQARYIEVLGMGEFNAKVRGIIDQAIATTGVASFTPEVFEASAGLADRGCAAGATELPAADLLADPAFGPVDGDGTALVCDVTAAFGPILGITFRTVTGADGGVTSDTAQSLLLNLDTGGFSEAGALWTPEAATELWQGAVERLRRDAGALSAAPLQPPTEEQLALAQAALNAARLDSDALQFVLPAGITSDELAALGVPATTEPLTVTVEAGAEGVAGAPNGWLTPEGEQVLAVRSDPFVGVPAWHGAQPVDCALVACVAVTYDDGPSDFTAELLDTLAAQESAATFFMLGKAVQANPEVVARAASEGHELASHSMTHPDLTTITSDKARKQVLDAGKAITKITGQPVTMYRPPYGALDPAVLTVINQPAILWTIDTLDWQQPGEAELLKRAVDAASPGNIILFHDTHADTVNAAANILEGLKNRGLTPVTVTQLYGGSVPSGRVSGL